ncbi:MAG: trehalose-phosphatase [Candidatus Jacksonbacteria bacterium RIFCSPHIGHO2_12_FULL_44_12]|nr:MAG: trehalose-phosphatase [Candidatus Jacksonbacteria bacterium RIFCSPHIGHO2_12_FULL_44_12]
MKDLFKSLPELSKKLFTAKGCLVMLDFDGTLSPLAKTPSLAYLPKTNKEILKKISRLAQTAIVSGRGLSDIKQKIGIKGLIYSGNHGLEWQIGSERGKIKLPATILRAMALANKRLTNLRKGYPGALLENKGLTLSLHYRLVSSNLREQLLKEAREIVATFQKQRLLAMNEDKKTLEIRPHLRWNKGHWVKFLRKKLGKQLLPIYIGDSTADEDVFKILKSGITIKVGKGCDGKAKYLCRDIKQVNLFLNWLSTKL